MKQTQRIGYRKSASPTYRDGAATIMGVQMSVCQAGLHICKHRGSKPDPHGSKQRRRARNKVARASRRANR